jgi:hypothetical protein
MILSKTFIVALALAIGIALSPVPVLTAAPFSAAEANQSSSDLVRSVQAKKKAEKKPKGKVKKKGKRKKAAKETKSCGTLKYRKGGKCLDARDKK